MKAPRISLSIALGSRIEYALAQRCAEIIHGEIVNRHLLRLGHTSGEFFGSLVLDREVDEVRELFRSLPAGEGRAEFRRMVKFLLSDLLEKKGTDRRWQDYVRRCASIGDDPCPATNDDPAWATFILRRTAKAA